MIQSNGPFAKNDDSINVGQAYFGYKGFRDVALTVGRMPNPFVTTSMVWDADINPEGMAEQWKHTFKISLGGGESAASVASTSKDGKSVVTTTPSEPKTITIDLFANLAQFVYDDDNPENSVGPATDGVPQTRCLHAGLADRREGSTSPRQCTFSSRRPSITTPEMAIPLTPTSQATRLSSMPPEDDVTQSDRH